MYIYSFAYKSELVVNNQPLQKFCPSLKKDVIFKYKLLQNSKFELWQSVIALDIKYSV